jgi:cutinase
MTGVPLLLKSARLAATVSTLVCAAATCFAGAPAASAADPCSDVTVVFARGTRDAPDLGRPGQAFADSLQGMLAGRTMTTYAVNYPASYDFLTTQDGANDAANYIASLVAQCPSTHIVLGGYSQGAAVVDMLAGIPPLGKHVGDIGSAPPLAANLVPKIAAVVAFGNPATKFGNPLTSSVWGGKAIDLCADGDPICSRGRNPFAHSDYTTNGMTDQAASFVAGIV